MTLLLCSAALLALAQNDKTQANSHDDGWENAWVTHCKGIYTTSGKTLGFVLQIGDSITHANPYSQWPRYGSGKTTEDGAICTWANTTAWNSGSNSDTSVKNGFYLAAADTHFNRGMTASSGIATFEYISGSGNDNPPNMPTTTVTATALGYVSAADYDSNLQIDTVAAAFADAQFAVVMLGTNDVSAGQTTSAFQNNLAAIIDTLEARNIVVILSTIPPRFDATDPSSTKTTSFNAVIRTLAYNKNLPMIDYEAEILARKGGSTWQNTLISNDGIHPTLGPGPGSAEDPYTPGGDPTTHKTGDACLSDGYLLRSWLTIQKLKEVKGYIIDGVAVPGSPPPPPPSSGSGSGGGGSDSGRCGCGTAGLGGSIPWAAGLALAAAGLLLASRKAGF